jgi:uncharacterized protein DUF1707
MTGEMSPLGRGDDVVSPGELRASHDDRDRVVELLRVAAGEGRLSPEELDERLEQALTARTHGELALLTRDLSAAPGLVVGAPIPEPKELVRIDCHSGSTRRDGRWLVPQRMQIRLRSGSVRLDFTDALITQSSLQIDADVHSGTLTLVTRPGIVVDTDDVAVRSGGVKVQAPWDADSPTILRIQLSGTVRSGTITARPPRPPRRSFWQWLLRRPRPAALPHPGPR